MSKSNEKQAIRILAIDLAKTGFQLHGTDETGHTALRAKLNHKKLSEFLARLPACPVAMEGCGSAHY